MVVCPGCEGDLGIMVGHLPLITPLRSGTLTLFQEGALIFSMNVYAEQKSMLHVTSDGVTIMMEEWCPFTWDSAVMGAKRMKPLLRVESHDYGSYKMDASSLEHFESKRDEHMHHYLPHHKIL